MNVPSLSIAAMLVLAACGGSSEQGADSELATLGTETEATSSIEGEETSQEEVDPEVAFAEFDACMAEQGVEMPDVGGEGAEVGEGVIVGGGDGTDFDIEDFDAANSICEPILESAFGEFELSPEQEAEMADQMLEMEKCLSEKGIKLSSSGNSIELSDDGVSPEEMDAAFKECAPNDVLVGE